MLAGAAAATPAAAQAPEAAPQGAPATAPAPGPVLALDVSGTCPSREAVLAALLPALAKDARLGDRIPLLVVDLGDRFQVAAGGQTRQYDDAARDCGERARVAAVYMALALNPPIFEAPPPPPPPPPPTVVRPAPAAPPAPEGARWGQLGIAARIDGAAAGAPASSTAIAAGAELRGGLGWRWFGVALGAGILSSTTNMFASVPVSERRYPCSVALTAHRRLATSLQIAGDLGVALVPFTLLGEGLQTSDASTRLDVGARLAVALGFPAVGGVAAPFVDLHAEVYPRAYVVNVGPTGDIGETSRVWVGVSAGVALGSR